MTMGKDSIVGSGQTTTKAEEQDKFKLKNTAGDYLKGGSEIGNYFLRIFGKKDPSKPKSFNLSVMHGINRISLIIFILAVLYLIGRKIF